MTGQMLLFLLGCVFGAWGIRYIIRQRKIYSLKKISNRAKIAECEAAELLRKKGYHILEAQARMPVKMMIDAQQYESYIKADYIVEKKHKRYLAEVKTGKQANPRLPNVRRQLFEYQNLFQTDGILFIDMNNYDIIEVSFCVTQKIKSEYKCFLGGIFIGVCMMIFLYSYF